MSSTPEENRPPEQPRWGQRRPEGSVPHQQPDPSSEQGSDHGSDHGAGQSPGYGRSAGYGETAGYGQPPHSYPPYGSTQGPGTAQQSGYGQSGYGQSGYGRSSQGQSGGGQFGYGAPQGPVQPGQGPQGGPGTGTAPSRKPKRPMTLVLAMVLMLLAGATVLTLSVLSFLDFTAADPQDIDPFWTQVAEESQAQQGPGAEELSVQDILLGVGVMVLLGGIILAALYAVFAFVGTMTGNVGRILATIFLAGSVFMILFGPENLIVTGLSLAAIVALWLPASNTYVRERKAWKEFSRPGSPYAGPAQPGPQNWAAPQQNPYGQQDPYGQQGQNQQPGQYGQNPPQNGPYGGSSPR